ncbi:MAG: glycoside hydrolase family 9 [Opitutus sp.]|nr:glycoside hydrolase family 9 [Opitutus sp.]
MKWLTPAIALGSLVTLVGCGGGGGGGSVASTPSAATTPSAPSPSAPPPATPNLGTVDPHAPAIHPLDYTKLVVPEPGSHTLHILSPNLLELVRLNRQPRGGGPDSWDFVDANGRATLPQPAQFAVTVNGRTVAVQQVGFKRRPLHAPLERHDLRILNNLVLRLAEDIPEGATVAVRNPDSTVFSADANFAGPAHPLRFNPAIHVNQEGYVPAWPKKAQVGYYLGDLGELAVPDLRFSVVNAVSGRVVHQGSLTQRSDSGWPQSPYLRVYEADFSSVTTPGEYKLMVPGLGASLPFLIEDGIAMNFARTYAQGLYHQRCGHPNELPFTRHDHAACHTAPAAVPSSANGFGFTWSAIRNAADTINSDNPTQLAARLTSPAAVLFPFNRPGPVDVSGGHHDAGDYSKYTINSASLLHLLVFAADAFPGVSALDNLGLPESGDGVGDILQEAKIEADFLLKLQDSDGGFYFLVYPRDRAYEHNVLPDAGDPQVVWPKNTAATAAAVAALAEAGSSPKMKAAFPSQSAAYLAAAWRGWEFLTSAIARHGKAGSYQKITHYGDDFTHDDELAWAAAAMFAATGDRNLHQVARDWFNPSDRHTWRWGWWHAYAAYGNALRTYAFAARTGRRSSAELDGDQLRRSEDELRTAANDALRWASQSAYGTSFPLDSKRTQTAGWYFSAAQSFDLAVAYQLEARSDYFEAIVSNLNHETGSNAMNVSYVTGLGWKRPHEIVHQYAQNDGRALPPNGLPYGNLVTGPIFTGTYGVSLGRLTYPRDDGPNATPFYDRWIDTHNVLTEFVVTDQARGLATVAFLATLTPTRTQNWRAATASINGVPANPSAGSSFTVSLSTPGMDQDGARILWEGSGQQPALGESYTFTSQTHGAQWIEAEAHWPDGRRVVARRTLFAENGLPNVSVTASDATARLGTDDTGTFTFTRTGDARDAITISFRFGGSAAKWTDYWRPETGDMPESVTFAAGEHTAALTFTARANSSNANPHVVVLTLNPGTGYNVGNPNSASVTIQP